MTDYERGWRDAVDEAIDVVYLLGREGWMSRGPWVDCSAAITRIRALKRSDRLDLAGDAKGETYTVGGADGITRTFKRDAPRCERCHGEHFDMAGNRMPCPSCSGTALAPPGTGGGR